MKNASSVNENITQLLDGIVKLERANGVFTKINDIYATAMDYNSDAPQQTQFLQRSK